MTGWRYLCALAAVCAAGCALDEDPDDASTGEVAEPLSTVRYVSTRTWSSASSGWGPVERDRSNGERAAGDGKALTLAGAVHARGLGVHAPSDLRFALGGACTSFQASVGVDDEVGAGGSVVFQVWADGAKLYDSGVVRGTSATQTVSVAVAGARELKLVVSDSGDGATFDHADWASARVTCDSASPLPPTTSTLTWRMLALIVRNTDVTFTDPTTGQSRRVTTRLTTAEEAGAGEAARQTPLHIHDWSGALGRTTLDVLAVNDTVRSVSAIGNGFWVSPSNVSGLLDAYAPDGAYDSVFVIWDPDGQAGNVPTCCFYGMGRGWDTNGATYAAMPVFSEDAWGGPAPGEAFVHEWLHGSTAYYRTERGFNTPDPHDNAIYGYPSADGQGSWAAWYIGMLSGTLVHGQTSIRAGLSSTVWASGTPTRPVGPLEVGPPTHLRASAGTGAVSLWWTANSRADHYRIFRGTASGSETYLGWTRSTSAYDPTPTPGQLYYYVVRSVASGGVESLSSNEVSARP